MRVDWTTENLKGHKARSRGSGRRWYRQVLSRKMFLKNV